MQLKELENFQQSFYLFIGVLGFLTLVGIIWFILMIIKQHQKTIEWRNSLTRGTMVSVDHMEGKQEFWNHNSYGTITLRMYGPEFWFLTVDINKVWPLEESIEWELI
jgi:hypothetical protein